MTSSSTTGSAATPVPVVLGLGGNVGDVKAAFATAIRALAESSASGPRPQADTATSEGADVRAPDGSASRDDPRLQASTGLSPNSFQADDPRLQASTGLSVIRTSRLYASSPWGVIDQPDFLNMAVELMWAGDVDTLFDLIHRIERETGRHRPDETRWGPRTLDIDILVFGDERIEQEALTIPHPRLHERRFVLLPLLDLFSSETVLPGYELSLSVLLAACPDEGEVRTLGDGLWEGWCETESPT